MSEELKPCPFCGEPVEANDYTNAPRGVWLLLHRCSVIGPISMEASRLESIRDRWNSRAPQPADALIAAGWAHQPEAVVRDEALAQANATIAARDAEIERLRAEITSYKAAADQLANNLDRVHYELPTGQDWHVSRALAAYEGIKGPARCTTE